MRAIRTATINHNEPGNPRVKINLEKIGCGYVWRTTDGEDCGLGVNATIVGACKSCILAWGSRIWDLRASWLH